MAGMAEAGFTVSHSWVTGGLPEIVRALDVAAASGVRLLLSRDLPRRRRGPLRRCGAREGPRPRRRDQGPPRPLRLPSRRTAPRAGCPSRARPCRDPRERDPSHLCYINHFPPIEGWGAPTAEAFWRRFIELVQPHLLSYDHYPITVALRAGEIEAQAGKPNVFAHAGLIVKPDTFSCLELCATSRRSSGLPGRRPLHLCGAPRPYPRPPKAICAGS